MDNKVKLTPCAGHVRRALEPTRRRCMTRRLTVRTPPGAHEVHLWRAPLDVPPQRAAHFATMLSDAESRRAARLRRPEDRARQVAARGWLRHLVATYLDTDPSVLVFEPAAHGKPRLLHPEVAWLRFNTAHSGAVVTFAVAREREIGVDVELLRDDVDSEGVARRFFDRAQRAELAALDPAGRTRAFFALWTRHEAYLKATGTGLAGAGSSGTPTGWTLAAFDAGLGYAAAVAVEGVAIDVPRAATELSA